MAENENRRISRKAIIAETARAFGLTVDEMIGPLRLRQFVRARFAAATLMRELHPKTSLPEIGRQIGGKDHTTVLHALCRAKDLVARDAQFAARMDSARKALQAIEQNPPPPIVVDMALRSLVPQPKARPAPEPLPQVKPKPLAAVKVSKRGTFLDRAHGPSGFDHSDWWRENDERFRRALARAHPELVRVPMREAAE